MQPQNILIQEGQVKLGLVTRTVSSAARCIGVHHQITSSDANTVARGVAYTAPEVIDGGQRSVSKASDIYSFGMLLYYLTEMEAPWDGEWDSYIVRQVMGGHLPPFR